MSYTQLTEVERYQVHTFLKPGYEHNRMAEELNRSPSTISRELKRNRGLRGYRPAQAWRFADKRKPSHRHTPIEEVT